MQRDPVDRPAPGPLELVRSFVNTLDIDKGGDRLDDAGAAVDWFVAAGLLSETTQLRRRDLERAVRLREAFRGVLVANAVGAGADEAVRVLNDVAAEAGIVVRMSGPRTAVPVVTAPGFRGAVGQLLAIAFEAMHDGTWARLKACPADGCHWAFYDASRNRSSRWCDMGVCGNRAKREAFRLRHRLP